MKKVTALFLALLMLAASMSACGEAADTDNAASTDTQSAVTTAAPAETEADVLPLGLDKDLNYDG